MQVRVQHKETLLLFSISVFIMTFGALFIWRTLNNRTLTLGLFVQQQQAWLEQPNFDQANQAALDLYTQVESMSALAFKQQLYALLEQWPQQAAITHLASSRVQIRSISEQALRIAQDIYPDESLVFFDRVYARDPIISILLNQPQAYLFFLTTSDQRLLVIISLAPNLTEGGYHQHSWHIDARQPLDQALIDNLLSLYHQVIR